MSLEKHHTVLLIDDSAADRAMYCRYLQRGSAQVYHILEADSASGGLELYRRSRPDVILLDYLLPGMDGLEFLTLLMPQLGCARVAVLILTEQGNEAIAVQAIQQGAQDYLIKSHLTAVGLCKAVEQALKQFQLQQQLQQQQQQQQIISAIALSIRQSLQLEEILETTVIQVRQLLNADRVLIYQFQPDMSGTIITESVLPDWTVTLGCQIEDTCFQENAGGEYRLGKKRAIDDIYQADLTACHLQLLEWFDVKANLVAPILVGDGLWGLLIAHQCSAPRQWQLAELNLLDQLVVQIAIAIQQATAYQQVQTELAERQRIEASLRASEQRYAALTQIVPVGIFQTDAAGYCRYVNQRWCQIAGLSPEQAAGYGWLDGIHLDDRELVAAEWYAATRANRPFDRGYRFQPAAGHITWVWGQAVAEYGDADEIVGYVGIITDISERVRLETERKQAEEALRLSEERFRAFMEHNPAAAWITDADGRIEYASPTYQRMFLTPCHIVGHSVYDLYPTEIAQVYMDNIQMVARNGQVLEIVEPAIRSDGSSGEFLVFKFPLPQLDGCVLIGGIAIDITDRKQAEEQLQKSDAHLKTAQRIAKLGSWEFDLHTWQIRWSDEVFRIFGYDPTAEPPSFEELQQLIHPDERDQHQQVVQTAIETVQSYEIEYRLYRPDGTLRYIQARGEPIVDAAGHLIQLVGTILDITEAKRDEVVRKQTEAQLRNLTDRLTLALQSGAIAIWDWNILENRLSWDDRMYELYGITPDQFTNAYDAWATSLHPDDRSRAEAAIQQALTGEQDYDPEFRVVQPDGTIRCIKAYALVQRNAHGEPIHMIGINFDITDRKQRELTLRQTTTQLEASNRELEAFAYSVSHDLRSPLRAIDGFSRALLEDYGDQFDAEGKNYFDRIRHNVSRMGLLIDELLRLSRVSRSEMQYSTVNLSALVQEQLNELQTLEPERQVTVVIAPEAIVLADITLMQTIVANLLQNAWKFTSHHATARIEFGVIHREEHPTYFVRDDGAGFDMAYANMLFGVFQRLHNTDEFPGTGIGLATIQRAIHRHGGKVWAEGTVEQGATIYFTVPNTPTRTGT